MDIAGRTAVEWPNVTEYRTHLQIYRARNERDESSVKKCCGWYYLCIYVRQDEKRSSARSMDPYPELLGDMSRRYISLSDVFFFFFIYITYLRALPRNRVRFSVGSIAHHPLHSAEKKRARRITDRQARRRNINFIYLPVFLRRVHAIPEYKRSSQAAIIM